ncbi:MAG TPA: hypothetical protein VNY33_07280 [Gaiellaceae bacterium]|jgi:hypothetical protein|nr:hypothetical protein [Gaiellaceae bacterium]
MSLYELEIGWASTAGERRYLHWELLACEQVCGVFLTARDDVLAVLFNGDRLDFRAWASSLATTTTTPTRKGAFG